MVNGPVGGRVFASPSLQGSLVLLHRFPGGTPDPQCQENVATFLSDIAAGSPALRTAVSTALSQFKSANADLLRASPLADVARSLGV
jgi:hypothetical protein